MTAGVPGSGIGGFFYLLSALLMPVQESISLCQRKSSRATRRMVVRQGLNALGVLLGVWLTGWFISRSFSMVSASMYTQNQPALPILRWGNLVSGLVTLLSVLLVLQFLSYIVRLGRPTVKRSPKI